MKEIGKLVDMSTWTGNWPFIHLRYGDMYVLKEKLKSINVVRAFIAPIEGILEQDPMRADRELLKKVKDSFFSPVPVIDLSYGNWQECMELALEDERVGMVKLLPNYHMYRLYEKDVAGLVRLAQQRNIVISIQMKIEDPRAQHPLMKAENVNYNDVIKTLSAFPEQIFILNNVLMSDLKMLMESLPNIYVDISCLEQQDILANLYKEYSLNRFLFSSHCPFFFPEGNLYKLKYADVDINEIVKVAYKNAERIFMR
jgi:uncharacterized protein